MFIKLGNAPKSTFSMSWNSMQVLVPLASALAVVAFCLVGAGKPSETSGRGPSQHGWAEQRCQGLGFRVLTGDS